MVLSLNEGLPVAGLAAGLLAEVKIHLANRRGLFSILRPRRGTKRAVATQWSGYVVVVDQRPIRNGLGSNQLKGTTETILTKARKSKSVRRASFT